MILEAFKNFEATGLIPDEIIPEKWGLFAKNVIALAEAADWRKRIDLEEKAALVITNVGGALRRTSPTKFPFSITLFQYVLGNLVQSGAIRTSFRKDKYFPPITAALEQLFPKTREIEQRCELK